MHTCSRTPRQVQHRGWAVEKAMLLLVTPFQRLLAKGMVWLRAIPWEGKIKTVPQGGASFVLIKGGKTGGGKANELLLREEGRIKGLLQKTQCTVWPAWVGSSAHCDEKDEGQELQALPFKCLSAAQQASEGSLLKALDSHRAGPTQA